MAYLVRLALAEDWHPVTASARLAELVEDPRVLRQMDGRVRRALADRPSEVAERAALTLDLALGEAQPA
jgi:hypothetical protein